MASDLYLLGPVNNVIKCHPFPLLSIFNGHGNLCSHTRPGENVRTVRNCRKKTRVAATKWRGIYSIHVPIYTSHAATHTRTDHTCSSLLSQSPCLRPCLCSILLRSISIVRTFPIKLSAPRLPAQPLSGEHIDIVYARETPFLCVR